MVLDGCFQSGEWLLGDATPCRLPPVSRRTASQAPKTHRLLPVRFAITSHRFVGKPGSTLHGLNMITNLHAVCGDASDAYWVCNENRHRHGFRT